jgi:hypothetical protein
LDFDGVLYDTANRRELPGAIDFVKECIGNGYRVIVHSERCEHMEGIKWIKRWLIGFDVWDVEVSLVKPSADMYIDDKGFRFVGTYPTMDDIFEFASLQVARQG